MLQEPLQTALADQREFGIDLQFNERHLQRVVTELQGEANFTFGIGQQIAEAGHRGQRHTAIETTPGCHHSPSIQDFGHFSGHKTRNVRGRPHRCQTQPLAATEDLPVDAGRGRLSTRLRARRVTAFSFPVTIAAAVAVVLIAAVLIRWVSRRDLPRQRALTRLLDAADALESRLRTARAEIEAITGDEDETVRTALQEMLRQRLWLQQHGATASVKTLDGMRVSIDEARARIDQQLTLVERARDAAP